jgi:dTDP-4-dehydrorhamnose reductase
MVFGGPIWVTGAGGLIGSYLVRELSQRGCPVRGLSHKDLELTDCKAVLETFLREKPPAVIHCAALSSSVTCQEKPSLARRVNVFTTRFLSDLCHNIPSFSSQRTWFSTGKRGITSRRTRSTR